MASEGQLDELFEKLSGNISVEGHKKAIKTADESEMKAAMQQIFITRLTQIHRSSLD